MESPSRHTFVNEHTAHLIQVHDFAEVRTALHAIGLHRARPTLVLVGGASGISEADISRLQQLFVDAIAPIAQSLGVAVVDGGTDAGIMRFIGRARREIGATFPLIGVAAIGTVILPDVPCSQSEAAPLEPNHTHFILVPGSQWGNESPWIAHTASVLSDGCPAVTIVINGGEITYQDVSNSIRATRPVLAVEGSGRTADKIAAAVRGEATDSRANQLVDSGWVQAIKLTENPIQLAKEIKQILSELLQN